MSFFIWHLLHFICYICRQPQLRYIPTGIDTDIYSLVYICMHVAGGCPFGYATPLTIHVPCVAQRPMRILRAVEGLAAPPDLVLNFFHFFVTHATHEYGPIGAWSACAWTWAARRLRGWGMVGRGRETSLRWHRKNKKFFQLIFCYFLSFISAWHVFPFILRFSFSLGGGVWEIGWNQLDLVAETFWATAGRFRPLGGTAISIFNRSSSPGSGWMMHMGLWDFFFCLVAHELGLA